MITALPVLTRFGHWSHSRSSPSPLRVGMAGVGLDRPQDWIVGIALLRAAIERLAIEGAKRYIEIKPGHKIWVTDEGLAKRDEIGAPPRDRCCRSWPETLFGNEVRHDNTAETDCVAGHVRLELRNVVANYPFERPHRFAGIRPNSGHRDYSRLSCGGTMHNSCI